MNYNSKLRNSFVSASVLLSICIIGASGCFLFGGGSDDPCGERRSPSLVLTKDADPDLVDKASTFTLGGKRFYKFSLSQQDVCPDIHINAEAKVWLPSQPTRPISAEGLIEWFVLFEHRFAVNTKSSVLSGLDQLEGRTRSEGVGLKQAFQDKPGEYKASVLISFDSTGDAEQDKQFARDNIFLISITTNYHDFIGEPSSSQGIVVTP